MKMLNKELRIAVILPLLTIVVTGEAQESEAESIAFYELEEFTVLSRQFGAGESRSVYTLTSQQIELEAPGAEITNSLNEIPGVQASTGDARGGSFSFEIYMRGLSDEQIGFSVDGIPTGDSRFNGGQPPNRFVDGGNIDSIVVSQSSGDIGSPSRFALGGFINFRTDDPKPEQGLDFTTAFGSFDYKQVFLRVDTGEIMDGVTSYFSYSHKENENYAGPNSRDSMRDHFEFKVLKEFETGTRIALRSSYNELEDNDFNIISLEEFEDDPTSDRATDQITGIPSIDRDFGGALGGFREDWLTYINADFVFSDEINLEVNPYYHTLRGESYRYQDRSRTLTGGDPRAVTGYDALGGAIRPAVITDRDSDTFGGPADMRVTPRDRDRYGITSEIAFKDIADVHTLRFGAWYESNESTEFRNFYTLRDSRSGIGYNESDLSYVEYERSAVVDTMMLYAQDRMSFLDDALKIDVGVTYLDVDYEAKSPLEYNTNVDFSQDSGLLPKIGFTYRVTDKVEVFGGAAINYGGIPEDVFLGSTAVINEDDLDPILSRNFDVGVRRITEKSALSLQFYYVDLDNNIGIVPETITPGSDVDDIIRGNVDTKAVNLEGIETWGIETSAFYDFGAVDVYAAYALQNAKHKDTNSAQELENLARNGILAGERVRDIPEHTLYARVGWDIDESFRISLDANYVGERVGGHLINPIDYSSLGIEEIDSHVLFGLNFIYKPATGSALENFTFQLAVDNLLDEEYISAVSGATATLPEFGFFGGGDLDRYFIGYPRTLTFSVSASF